MIDEEMRAAEQARELQSLHGGPETWVSAPGALGRFLGPGEHRIAFQLGAHHYQGKIYLPASAVPAFLAACRLVNE